MRTLSVRVSCLLTLLLFLPHPGHAQQPLDELTLGLSQRSRILLAHPRIIGTPANALAESVFANMLSTSAGRTGAFLPYEVTLITDDNINAFSTAAGKVYVTSGLASLLGEDRGMWAAVLGHELAHTMRQHQYASYLRAYDLQRQIAYYRARAAAGDNSANWALLGLTIGGGLANLKFSRDQEHDADRTGLMMMAEAGFHPDFTVTLQRRIRKKVGDQSKFAAFFSDHPRWATREERTMRAYNDALELFQARWPVPENSSGGNPPAIATLGIITAGQDAKEKTALVHVPLRIRNAKGLPVLIGVAFHKNNKPVPAAQAEFRGRDGSLIAIQRFTPESVDQSTNLSFAIPTAARGTKERKLEASVLILVGAETLDFSKPIKVSFPKP